MKRTRLISIAMVMALLLAACGGSTAFASSDTAYEGEPIPVEFMAWYPVMPNEGDKVIELVEDKFNVSLSFTLATYQPHMDNIAMRVASGDYPNVMLVPYYGVAAMGEQYTAMIEDGLLVNFSEAAAGGDYPNIAIELGRADDRNMQKIYGDSAGDYYGLPRDDGYANQALFVRQDWLDQLGLEQPATFEELKAVLEAVVAADPDGQGNVGMTFNGIGALEQFITGFTGVQSGGWYQNDDGAWAYKVYHPGFVEALKYIKDLYDNNLIDKEFMTMSVANARDKFNTGRAAMITHNGNGVDYTDFLVTPIQEYKAEAEVGVIVPMPKGPSGKRNGSNPYGAVAVIMKSGDEETDARVLDIFDYILSPEGTDVFINGIEGVHYTMDGDTRIVNEEERKRDFQGIESHLLRHFAYPGASKENLIPILAANYEDIKETGVAPEIVGLNTETTAVLVPNLNSVYESWVLDFVIGEADIDTQFDAFLAEYEAAGYQDMVREVTDFAAK